MIDFCFCFSFCLPDDLDVNLKINFCGELRGSLK